MMQLITDRKEYDVNKKTSKGVYGSADLNRVESAVAQIIGLARQMDIRLDLETKTDWNSPGVFPAGFPTESQMDRYISNVRAIRDRFAIPVALPASMRRLTHSGANAIERVLTLAFQAADQTIPNTIFCGEIFAGEE